MRSFRVLVLGLAVILVIGAAFFGRTALIGFFGNLRLIVIGSADRSFNYENFAALETENAGLKSQIANLLRLKSATSTPVFGGGRYDFLAAEVQSDYPWNDYAAVTIGAGATDGLKPGMPVLGSGGVLIGKIKAVSGSQSEVKTIFDPNWRSAVAVGSGRVKALLVGGTVPGLDLIPKDSGPAEGDDVLSVATGLPVDLPVGQIASLSETSSGLWAKAVLTLPWNPGNLDKVYVMTNFP